MKKLLLFVLLPLFLVSFLQAQTVYITKTGAKYHTSGCSYLKRSSIPIDLKEAVSRGYTPCSRCNPPTLKSENKPEKTQDQIINNNIIQDDGRCQAITKAGTRCKRKAQPGSKYCWQHQPKKIDNATSIYEGDKTIYTGPRGGKYYYNSKGKKVYIKRR